MTSEEMYRGLLSLADKLQCQHKVTMLDTVVVLEAAAFVLEAMSRSYDKHPCQQTSNGDPVATYWNNVVKIQKGQ